MIIAALLQAASVPPPLPQRTADCARPTYATDMLVCGDPVLRAMDEQLRAALRAPSDDGRVATLMEEPDAWFRRSRRCAFQTDHRGCALAAYREALAARTDPAGTAPTSGRCRLGATAAVLVPIDGGAAIVRDGRVIGVGLLESPAWRPFLVYRRAGVRVTMRGLDDRVVATCDLPRTAR